jgi:hypothetical protein
MNVHFPDTGGRVSGSFGLAGTIAPAQLTANQNDWNPTGLSAAAVIKIDTDANRDITGLQGGVEGRMILLEYVGTTSVTIKKDDGATSTAANRFDFLADIVLKPKQQIFLKYNATASRWKVLFAPQSGKQVVYIPAGAMKSRTTNGAADGTVETSTNRVMLTTKDFDASTQEFVQFTFPAIKGWDKGTVSAFFFWKHASTTTNFGVRWGLQGRSFANDAAADQAFGTAQEVTDVGGTTNDFYTSPETPAITIAGTPTTLDLVVMQAYRDPNNGADNLAIDAGLLGIFMVINIVATED